MSNTERNPQERVCKNQAQLPAQLPAQLSAQLSAVQILEPRDVPLGGPRAMNVRRTLPQRARSLVGAWCFLDFYGPDDVSQTGGMRVPRHPHTGLATVSWLFSGHIDHIDSAGNWATVRPGDAVFMNAGRGITHSEFATNETTVLHGAQLWYAFPDEFRFVEPSLDTHRPEPVFGPGWQARVFAGELLGSTSAVKTYTPLTGAELRLDPGTVLEIEVPTNHEHGLLAVSGAVAIEGTAVAQHHLAVMDTGLSKLTITAGPEPVLALLIGGEPLNEPIVMWWNFVGRTHEEIVTYRAAYQGELGFDLPPVGSPQLSGKAWEQLLGAQYNDGRSFPQFGEFPPDQPAALPAPELPNTRMKPRS